MKRLTIASIFLFSTLSALKAEQLMSPAEFESFSAGSTIYFSRHGQPYGAEHYMEGRQVIWTFVGGDCQHGIWYEKGDQICFEYDSEPRPLCWYFFKNGDKKNARVVGDEPEDDLHVIDQDNTPLYCPPPDIGVSYKP